MKKSLNLNTNAVGTEVRDALRYNYDARATPLLLADWNMNRYSAPTVDNVLPEAKYGFNVDCFPISSIVEPNRPNKGAAKALVGQSLVSSNYSDPGDAKFYIASKDDVYKYWISPKPTGSDRLFPNITTASGGAVTSTETCVQPTVKYDKAVMTNKIIIKVENTWATPDQWTVQVATNASINDWVSVGTNNMEVSASGVLALYRGSTGTWSTTKPTVLAATNITGIRILVTSLKGGTTKAGNPTKYYTGTSKTIGQTNTPLSRGTATTGANSNFALIAIEAHYEENLTDRLISTTDTFDLSDTSQVTPIGGLTTNTAGIVLDNSDLLFDKENTSSKYYGYLDANVEFNLQYIYTINNIDHAVQQFRMFGGGWDIGDGTVSIQLEDSSKFLKETKPRSLMYEGLPVLEIIWRILDSAGFQDYAIQAEDILALDSHIIPIFWTNGEDAVWEVIDELATVTQTAVYFDSYNKLQVRTGESSFNRAATPDWTLRGQKEGINLPDIQTLELDNEMESNKIVVNYKKTEWNLNDYKLPELTKVWEPDGDLVVRASPVQYNIQKTDGMFTLHPSEVVLWPYASKVQIDTEILEYDAKDYVYYTTDPNNPLNKTVKNTAWLTTADEKKACDAKTDPEVRWRNTFSGALRIKTRGMMGTVTDTHSTNTSSSYTARAETFPGKALAGGHTFNYRDSTLDIYTSDSTSLYRVGKSGLGARFYSKYGTKVRFNSANKAPHQIAGVYCGSQSGSDDNTGFFFEIIATESLTAEQKASGAKEIQFHNRTPGAGYLNYARVNHEILQDTWYEIDVTVDLMIVNYAQVQRVRMYVNGTPVISMDILPSTPGPWTGQYLATGPYFGVFTRYNTDASFEYLYAVDALTQLPYDDYSFYDLKTNGFNAGIFENKYLYAPTFPWPFTAPPLPDYYTGLLFDDFGPWCHEIRDFDIKFEPAPVQSSSILNSNEFHGKLLNYTSTPWGAKFTIVNIARFHAVLNGEDNIIYIDNAVQQAFTIIGRDLDIGDTEKVESRNEVMIRKRGVIESEISSDWLQSKAMAQSLADWIRDHWSQGVDQVSATVFGNPLLEIGDVVDVSYLEKHMSTSTHKYYVIGTSTDFEAGLSTTLTLRRVR